MRTVVVVMLLAIVASPLMAGYDRYAHLHFIENHDERPLSFLKAKKAASAGQAINGGEYAFSIKEYKMACEEFTSAVAAEDDPYKRAFVYVRLGETFLEMKEYPKAIACLNNAEGVLSKHRHDIEQLFKLIPRVYASTSRCYLRWGKIASAVFYLWAANRLADELGQGESGGRPHLDAEQQKLMKSPLYQFIRGRAPESCGDKESMKSYYADIEEGDAGFAVFRRKAGMSAPLFLSPRPRGSVRSGAKNALFVTYTKGGRIVMVEHNSPEASDFNQRMCYRDGRPVTTASESHTYHSTDIKMKYDSRGALLWIMIATYPTQVNHHGFIPTVNFYSFE